MKIIVPIRSIPDPDRPIRVTTAGEIDVVRWIANPVDEAAVNEAVRLAGDDGEVIVVSTNEEHLLSGLARGAARGVLIYSHPLPEGKGATGTSPQPSPWKGEGARGWSKALVVIVGREQADVVLMGDDGELGPRLAGALGVPQATQVQSIDLVTSGLRVTRELTREREVLDLSLPAVVCLQPSFFVPRLISLYAIVDAREKSVERMATAPAENGVTVIEAVTAPSRRIGRMVGSVDELVDALREEARVL